MCETKEINKSIERLSRRTFSRRISLISASMEKERLALARLNRNLDSFYDMLYDAYPSITEEDYNDFAPYLQLLIQTLDGLLKAYRKSPVAKFIKSGIDSLHSNLLAIKEIDSDIRNFRIDIHKNAKFQELMAELKSL